MRNFYLIALCLYSIAIFSQQYPVKIKLDPENMETCDLGLSDFVESIEYIPLETKDECVIGQGMVFDMDETHIIVKFNGCKSVYLFDRKGHFLNTIGNTGGGPQEFIGVGNIFLDADNNSIIVHDIGKVLYFNKQGKFLRSTPLPIDNRNTVAYFRGLLLRTAESYIFRDSTYNVYQIYNPKGQLIKEAIRSIPIPLKKDPNWRISYVTQNTIPVYTYHNMPHVREYLNDTVYAINELNQFNPKYVFNLGKYKVTPEIQSDIEHWSERTYNKVFLLDIIEMKNTLLIQYTYQEKIHSCYYNKKENKLYKFKSRGYPNDYDGGIDFEAVFVGQKNRIARTAIEAADFISFLEEKKPDNQKIKGPKSAVDAFKKLAKKVDEEDNPIIMIMKLKE